MNRTPKRLVKTAGLRLAAALWVASTGAWAQVSSEYARPAALTSAAAPYTGDKLSLSFQNIDVRSVLQVIADFTNLNVVTSDSVTGHVTLRLKDVPWDQALDIILQSRGLGVRRTGNVMLVAPREELAAKDQADLEVRRRISELEAMRTESFQLHYSRAEEVAKGLLGATIGSPAGAGSPVSSAPVATPAVGAGPAAMGSPRLLSSRGSVIAEVRTNQLFVTDIPSRLEQVRALIRKIDIPVKQVLIEARIVEATDTFGRSLGAKLGLVQAGTPQAPSGGPGDTPKQGFTNAQWVNLPASPIQGVDPASVALSLFGASASRFLNLEISALEADGQGKVVSSPRIVTADQVEAYIKQGFKVPYRGTPSPLSNSPQIQFQEANLRLTVTPQITPEGHVILSVMVNKDSLGAITPDGREINTKEVKTKVLVENGGTVVIGGIYEHEEASSRTKVPFLGDVPVLGSLLRSSGRQARRTELLVFLTPRVITELASAPPGVAVGSLN